MRQRTEEVRNETEDGRHGTEEGGDLGNKGQKKERISKLRSETKRNYCYSFPEKLSSKRTISFCYRVREIESEISISFRILKWNNLVRSKKVLYQAKLQHLILNFETKCLLFASDLLDVEP